MIDDEKERTEDPKREEPDRFLQIYELFEKQSSAYRDQVIQTFRLLSIIAGAIIAGIGAMLYFFLGDQVTTLEQRSDQRLASLENRVNGFLSDTRTRVDETLANERLSNQVQAKIVSASLEQAELAVKEAIDSPEVAARKDEFSEDILEEINESLQPRIAEAVIRTVNEDVRARLQQIDANNSDLFRELFTDEVLNAVRKEIDTFRGDKGDQGPIGPRGERGETGPQGERGLPGENGRDGTDANFPAGAVLAFDLPSQCPDGWSPFAEGQGRVVVGASFGIDDNLFRGTALTQRKYRDHGGEERVTLTEAQMPEHRHISGDFDSIMTGVGAGQAPAGLLEDIQESGRANLYRRGAMPVAGGSEPHNNMPPYIALYLCKKD